MRVIEAKGFRVAYDPQVPALSVRWAPPPYALTKEIDDVRHVDYGHDGRPAAAEFLYVDEGVDLRGVPRAAEFAPLLDELGIPITHPPEASQPAALAQAVADMLVGYRARHGLSLRALARKLGMKHPMVVRLERGDHTPDLGTLEKLAGRLGIRFAVYVGPGGISAPTPLKAPDLIVRQDDADALVLVAVKSAPHAFARRKTRSRVRTAGAASQPPERDQAGVRARAAGGAVGPDRSRARRTP